MLTQNSGGVIANLAIASDGRMYLFDGFSASSFVSLR